MTDDPPEHTGIGKDLDTSNTPDPDEIAHDLIGVAGGSGAGKSTLTNALCDRLDGTHVEMDWFYIPITEYDDIDDQNQIQFDHPDAIDWDALLEALADLRSGTVARVPTYDFATATRTGWRRIEPSYPIVVEGIHALVDERARSMYDVNIYVEHDDDIRLARRIRRDIEERGEKIEDVLEKWEQSVRPMHKQHVEPTKNYAQYILQGDTSPKLAVDWLIDDW